MNPPIQTIRLSKQEVDILNSLKRKVKINQWNTLCRMAFCISCANPAPPPRLKVKLDGGVELDWETFSGSYKEIYVALVTMHYDKNRSQDPMGDYFRRVLFRGILTLKEKIKLNKIQ